MKTFNATTIARIFTNVKTRTQYLLKKLFLERATKKKAFPLYSSLTACRIYLQYVIGL